MFQQPVREAYALGEMGATAAFSTLIAAYGLGCVLGGFLQDKRGPRCAALRGTALLEAGLWGAVFLPARAGWAAALVFSVPAGLGTAFLYPAITLFVRTLAPRWGIRGVFGALGALSLPVCLAGAALLTDPPAAAAAPGVQKGPDVPPAQMLRTRQYWLCTAAVCLSTPAVLLFSPIILRLGRTRQYWLCTAAVCLSTPAVLLFSPIILRLGTERGLTEGEAVWAVVLGSAGSTAGRLLMPLLSDKIGRRPTDLLLFGASAGLSAGFAFAQGWAVTAVYAGLTFCYSALAAVLPAFSTDLFGLPHAGVNYGFLAAALPASGFLSRPAKRPPKWKTEAKRDKKEPKRKTALTSE